MDLPLNPARPMVMHIDLNSCFATVEQQANPLLRGKPVVVAAYGTYWGAILSPSIEAKRAGIKMGMKVGEAKAICPEVVVLIPDPPKYRAVHQQFDTIFKSYSPDVVPKSIDEAVIDFSSVQAMYQQKRKRPVSIYPESLPGYSYDFFSLAFPDEAKQKMFSNRTSASLWQLEHACQSQCFTCILVEIAREIKERMRNEIGEWISCSIGIAPNRWWAKTGAGYYKPDGLTVITDRNVREIFSHLTLLDLCGINLRYEARLNRWGIRTPLQFLDASLKQLQKQVFQSIGGYYWYLRLRGYEIDKVEFGTKTYGQQYALTSGQAASEERLLGILMKLCEKMGRRLRKAGKMARGVCLALSYRDKTYWQHGQTFPEELYTTFDFFIRAREIFYQQPEKKGVTKILVNCFRLSEARYFQDTLFDTKKVKQRKVSDALDGLHDRYGEYVVTSGLLLHAQGTVLDRIAFGKSGIVDGVYG